MIIRIKKDKNYKAIRYDTAIKDTNLSWKAKGVWTYLMCNIDDWQIYQSELVKHSTDGITSLVSAIKELIEHRYVTRRRVYVDGRFKYYEYTIYEMPLDYNEYLKLDKSPIRIKQGEILTSGNLISENLTLTKNININ